MAAQTAKASPVQAGGLGQIHATVDGGRRGLMDAQVS